MSKRCLLIRAAILDVLIGDPRSLPHPVQAIGVATRYGERVARERIPDEGIAGALLTVAICTGAALVGAASARFEPFRTLAAASALAFRSLVDHVAPIAEALDLGDVGAARSLLARCVGRDTDALDEPEIARAAIETLAESLCDGVIAPLLALRAFGVAGAFAYKAINTLDSLIGHPEEPYTRFGAFAARLDDVANWIPARVAAVAISLCAPVAGGDISAALRVWQLDGGRHRSPNAGQSEAAMAGALAVRLGGPNVYDGVLHEGAHFGEHLREPGASDIRRAIRVIGAAYLLCVACLLW